jgi:hypothetical protein
MIPRQATPPQRIHSMTLIPQEKVLFQTHSKTLTLTSHRVFYHTEAGGRTHTTSIMLEDLCSCSAGRTDAWMLVVVAGILAVFAIILAIIAQEPQVAAGGLIPGVILVIVYFATRRATLALASAGAEIRISIIGMKVPEVAQFITRLTEAKDARFRLHDRTSRPPVA